MDAKQRWIRIYRVTFAVLTIVAIAYQFWQRTFVPGFRPSNFFSFFTIQSNLIAAAVLLWTGFTSNTRPSTTRDLIRGAAVTYLSITFVVYGVLLSGLQEALQMTIPWVDSVLHKIIPIVLVVDWLIEPPSQPISLRQGVVWLAYPLLYAVYTLIRGPLVGWYPYPFLNPDLSGGYPGVALYCVGITIAALLFAWLVVLLGRRVRLVAVKEEARIKH